MSTLPAMEGIGEVSPRLTARIAGVLYMVAVLAAVFAEFIVPGRLGIAAIVVPVSCYAAVMLLLYVIFERVSRSLAVPAMLFGLVGLAFEAFRLQPGGVNAGMACHGFYCLLIGLLIFKSTFLPRILGAFMVLAGLIWLIYLAPALANRLAPYNSAFGLLGEAAPMLWLLVMGVNTKR
jgi:hypothetical protein